MKTPTDILRAENISFGEFAVLMYLTLAPNKYEQDLLLKKGFIAIQDNKFVVTTAGKEAFRKIVFYNEMNADEFVSDDTFIDNLRKIFPEGKKGTSGHWSGTKNEIRSRLREFVKTNPGYTKDQILQAAKNYVDSFNCDYTYMQLLKYFIWKVKRDEGGTYVDSQLLSHLEHLESDNVLGNGDYMHKVR